MKTSLRHFIILSGFTMVVGFAAATTNAEPSSRISGEIKFEEAEKKINTYDVTQDKTIDYFKTLVGQQAALGQGGAADIAPLVDTPNDSMLNYLSGVYLYCAIKNGVCPLVLDAVLEVDLARSKQSGTIDCPMMTGFWKHWSRNEFDKRLKYNLGTGQIMAVADFESKQKPRYLQCKETIARELADSPPAAQFFKTRYAPGSPPVLTIAKMAKLLELLKEKVPDVFVAVGAR